MEKKKSFFPLCALCLIKVYLKLHAGAAMGALAAYFTAHEMCTVIGCDSSSKSPRVSEELSS